MTRAKDISKIITDADFSGTLDVTGDLTVVGSSTFDDIKLTTVALPAAGNPSIALRDTNNIVYHQSGSGNSIVLLDSSQNTMYNASSTSHIFNISNSEKMRIDSSGNVGINTSSPASGYMLHVGGSSGVHTKVKIEATTATGQAELDLSADPAGVSYLNLGDENSYNIGYLGYFHSDNSMRFQTNSAERMRIHDDGSVSIGSTSKDPQNGGSSFLTESLSRRTLRLSQSGTGNANIAVFFSGGNLSGTINISSGSTTYGSGSDYRIKENIVDLTDATTRLKQLKPKRFNFITNPDDEARDGFLAHEVSSIVPEAVIGEKDAVDENGEIIVQQLDPSKLVPLLVKTIQELEARIVALETA